MRILFLSGWFPYPPDNGSKLRIYNLLRGLGERHTVSLVTFSDRPVGEPQISSLGEVCSSVEIVPWKSYQPTSIPALLGLLNPTPRSIVDTFSATMYRTIASTIREGHFDVVVASELRTASYWRAFASVPAIFDDLEVGIFESKVTQATSPMHRWRHRLTQVKQQSYLKSLLPQFGACTVVSELERALVHQRVPGYAPIEVIPNCVRLAEYQDILASIDGNKLVFTGSFRYDPNHEAMVWFLEQIFPRIRATAPDVRLTITGDHAGMPLPPTRGVSLTGYVNDVRPVIASAAVSIVPLRMGGGTRLKILEAMALGTPVVSTTKGAEGLEVQNGRHLLLADTASDFAEAVVGLLQDRELHAFLAGEARKLVAERYDWRVVLPRFLSLVERVGGAGNLKDGPA
jgi:glycosyltransferase involved in cell wall biosynthesis